MSPRRLGLRRIDSDIILDQAKRHTVSPWHFRQHHGIVMEGREFALPTSYPQVKGKSLQAKLLTIMQVPCAIDCFKTFHVRSCYWITILRRGPTFRFLPVTLYRLVYLSGKQEDQQGGRLRQSQLDYAPTPGYPNRVLRNGPRYSKASRHSDRGRTDSAALCFGAGVLIARHGLFRECECAAPSQTV